MRWNRSAHALVVAMVGLTILNCSSGGDDDGGSGPSPIATTLALVSGNAQTGTVGAALASPIIVKVTDQNGAAMANVSVAFAVTGGGGNVASASVATNAQGQASTTWTLGTTAGVGNNVATATAAGLSGSPVTFSASGSPGAAAVVTALSGDGQTAVISTATAAPMTVQVKDTYGNPVPGATVTWTISGGGSGSTGATTTDAAGKSSATRTVGGTVSGYLTTATLSTNGARYEFVTLGTAVASSFPVKVVFLTPVTANQRNAFLDAAARWSSIVVTGFAPDTIVTGPQSCSSNTPAIDTAITSVMIYATVAPIDGPEGVLGGASPCWVRLPGLTAIVGNMTFDSADLPWLELDGVLKPVILHEMGHVIGFGSLWNCPNPPIPGFPCTRPDLLVYGGTDSTHFVGTAANDYYAAAGGPTAYPSLLPVPVENTGGPGTQDGHWRDVTMTNELMTGYIDVGESPLSAITIGSVADMGYGVNYTTAESYTFSAPPVGAPGYLGTAIPLRELPRTGPIHGVDRQGRMTRMR